jgi:hypothetical protein
VPRAKRLGELVSDLDGDVVDLRAKHHSYMYADMEPRHVDHDTEASHTPLDQTTQVLRITDRISSSSMPLDPLFSMNVVMQVLSTRVIGPNRRPCMRRANMYTWIPYHQTLGFTTIASGLAANRLPP